MVSESGWNLWGVVNKPMVVASGYGCKEILVYISSYMYYLSPTPLVLLFL